MRVVVALLVLAVVPLVVWLGLGSSGVDAAREAVAPVGGPAETLEPEAPGGRREAGVEPRDAVDLEATYDDLMRKKYVGWSARRMREEGAKMQTQVHLEAMRIAAPLVHSADAPLGSEVDVTGKLFLRKFAFGHERVYVLDEDEHGGLYARKREAVWLLAEAARNDPGEDDGGD